MNTQKAPYRHADGSNCWTKNCRLGNTSADSTAEHFEQWIPKSTESVKGGWLRNSKPSQYVTRVAMRLLGVDQSTVVSTLKELEREGRGLPQVSGEEAVAYFDDQARKTATSEIIDEHERTIRLNQLEKVREFVKNGVAGSRMYAWKNVVSRIGTKMRTFAVVGFLAPTLLLSACSAGTVTPSQSTSPSATTSTSQTATPAPSITANPNVKTIPGSGQVASDKYGKYEHAAPVKATIDDNGTDPSAKSVGFSNAEIKSAQNWVADFVSTQGVDSSAVDGDKAAWDAWTKANAAKYFDADNVKAIISNKDASERSSVIYNNPKDAITPLVRDGGVRISSEKLSVDTTQGFDNTGYKRLQIGGEANVAYRVSPEQAQAALKAARPNATEAQLKAQFPKAFNAKEDKLTLTFKYLYSVRPVGDSWKITGYSNTFQTAYAYN
jgi:hypothetical protein